MISPMLTICIPTYQNYDQLRMTLHSLVAHTEYPYKIVVINNDGSPDSSPIIKNIVESIGYGNIEAIQSNKNLGWMGAINLGFTRCDTPYYCMLNDDVIFPPNSREFWRTLIQHFNLDKVAAVGPCSNFVAGTQNLFNLNLPLVFESTLLIGFCKVVRADAFREVGCLDIGLVGGDDLDLSIRFRSAGYTLVVDRSAYLHHIGQQTGHRVHKGFWDSQDHQEQTNNAIIRKHGFAKWNECFSAGWKQYGSTAKSDHTSMREDEWYEIQMDIVGRDSKGLNLGCGDKKVGNAFGMDISRKGDAAAGGQKFASAVPDTTANAMDLPVQSSSVDYIMAPHLLEHLVNPLAALEEWRRVLKPKGQLMITMPNHDCIPTMLIDYTHVHAYTIDSAKRMIMAAGFIVEEAEENLYGTLAIRASLPEEA